MITAVAVVVPARDEAAHVGACLDALLGALRALPPRIARSVCLVADRCADATAGIAADALGPSGSVLVNEKDLTIGEIRDAGLRNAVAEGHPPERTLFLSTDADSTVAPDWAAEHLGRMAEGQHAVAGAARLAEPFSPSALARHRYQGVLDQARCEDGHGNVYGANLGIRADAYLAAGGFPAVRTGEDHELWRRIGLAGYRRCYDSRAVVTTSARLRGRATDGLAALLKSLHDRPQWTPG